MSIRTGLIGILLSGLCWGAIAPTVRADSSLATAIRRGHLRVGIDAAIGNPYVFWNPKTQYYDGFEWEIAREIIAKLKLEARPLNIPWAGQPENLAARKVDLIIGLRERGSLDNGATKGKFAETGSYYRNAQRLLVHKNDASISTLRDLVGKRVGVIANSGGAAILETFNNNRGNAIRLFSSRDIERLFNQLRDRQLDAMLLDEPIAVRQIQRNPNLKIVGEALLPIELVLIVNKDDESLKKAINQALTQMRQEGKLETILRRWKLWDNNQKISKSAEGLPAISSMTIMLSWDYP